MSETHAKRPSFFASMRLRVSARLVGRLLAQMPNEPSLLERMSLIQLNLGRHAEAAGYLERLREVAPREPNVHFNLARALEALERGREALRCYDKAIALKPDFADAIERRKRLGERLRAAKPAAGARSATPAASADAATPETGRAARRGRAKNAKHYEKALALQRKGRVKEAGALFERVVQIDPGHAGAVHRLGVLALRAKRADRAQTLIRRAIGFDPEVAEYHADLGVVEQTLGHWDDALACHDRALELDDGVAGTWCNRGDVLAVVKRFEEALASYERAIAIDARIAEAHLGSALALQALRRTGAALEAIDRAIALAPDIAGAHVNRGNALAELGRPDAALESFAKALELETDHVDALVNRALVLGKLERHDAALADLKKAYRLAPGREFLLGDLLVLKMRACEWDGLGTLVSELRAAVRRGAKAADAFAVLTVADAPALHRQGAAIWLDARQQGVRPTPLAPRKRERRIRVGYYSADFHRHATSYLIAGLFERHDRSRIEVIGFSFDPAPPDAMRERVAAGCDRFVDVLGHGDESVARMSREMGVDIAVDLKGYTRDAREGIFVRRAAPIQVSYLGYPGTLGGDFMDYLIADPVVVPEAQRAHYSEKVVWLPHSYQVNDDKRAIAEGAYARTEAGLPGQGFVYCCFCTSYKIQPAIFDVWMRLLKTVPGSVLWLLEDNPTAAANLRAEAKARGVEPARLVFAPRVPLEAHLARHRLADLFLDTLPVGAHTTASDALWAGLPVLSCTGEAFASRVAASLLRAIGLPELVTSSLAEYEALALDLATRPEMLAALKRTLEANRQSAPLFDTQRFAKHIETAYETMVERWQAGEPPEHFSVPD